MNACNILIVTTCIVVFSIIILILRSYYRKIIKEKERGIVRRIREQDQFAKDLERIRMEKEILEKMLNIN